MVIGKYASLSRLLVLFLMLLSPFLTFAKMQGDVDNLLLEAFKSNNAKAIAELVGQNVSLAIKNDSGFYSKFQAEVILADFFRSNKTTQVKQVQRTNRSNNNFYIVYQVKSTNASYRVFAKFNQQNGVPTILELRIE